MLSLTFLVMVGVAVVSEALDAPISNGYLYTAMAFSLAVERLNIRARRRRIAEIETTVPETRALS